MTDRVSEEKLNELYNAVAESLTDTIKNGCTEITPQGAAIKVRASAAYITAAIKFLKDNRIESPGNNPQLAKLQEAMQSAEVGSPTLPIFTDIEDLESLRQ